MWQLRAGVIGLLTLAAVGCGAANPPAESPAPSTATAARDRDSTPEPGSLPVQIDNQNFSDMNVYVVTDGQRWLLGQAGGMARTTLSIPAGIARGSGRVRLLAEPIGGLQPFTTPVLLVPPGQQVYWTIGSDPATSTATTG
jgi:hypothetical protein